jgi:hypothetical protein
VNWPSRVSSTPGTGFLVSAIAGTATASTTSTFGLMLTEVEVTGQLGNPNDGIVVMDHFTYAEPNRNIPSPRAWPCVARRTVRTTARRWQMNARKRMPLARWCSSSRQIGATALRI